MHTAFTPAPARPCAPRVRGTESAGSQYQQDSPQEANPRKQVTDNEQPSDVGAGSLEDPMNNHMIIAVVFAVKKTDSLKFFHFNVL